MAARLFVNRERPKSPLAGLGRIALRERSRVLYSQIQPALGRLRAHEAQFLGRLPNR